MDGPPFDAVTIAGTHSALTGVMAGFALAALFLLIQRGHNAKDGQIRGQYSWAMLLLFVAFLVGTLSSFVYSRLTGYSPIRAYLGFLFPSSVFAVQALVLLLGLNIVFGALEMRRVLDLARNISLIVVVFCVVHVWDDLRLASEFFGLASWVRVCLLAVMSIPIVSSFLVRRCQSIQGWFEKQTLSVFCYAVVVVSFGIAIMQGILITVKMTVPDSDPCLPTWVPIVLMICVSVLGAWSVLLAPRPPERLDEQKR
jgi:hypothetical protein